MNVSRRSTEPVEEAGRGPRARTRRLMLETATRLMQAGVTPSVSEVAEAAEVSRATAYRYFPSQAALVEAVVDEALGPILGWKSGFRDPQKRVADLVDTSFPRIDAFEATFRAALRLSLEEWAQRKAGAPASETPFRRGHRVDLLREALRPLNESLPAKKVQRLAQALSLIFGVEAMVVLKDMWKLDSDDTEDVVRWAASALVRSATEEV